MAFPTKVNGDTIDADDWNNIATYSTQHYKYTKASGSGNSLDTILDENVTLPASCSALIHSRVTYTSSSNGTLYIGAKSFQLFGNGSSDYERDLQDRTTIYTDIPTTTNIRIKLGGNSGSFSGLEIMFEVFSNDSIETLTPI